MTAVFRLGLAGAGRMGRTHLRALSASDRVRVTAIADPSDVARAELDGPGMSVFANRRDARRRRHRRALLIASPSPLHLGLVEHAANAGLPILCEKPCGITAAEARAAAGSPPRTAFRCRSPTGVALRPCCASSGNASQEASSAISPFSPATSGTSNRRRLPFAPKAAASSSTWACTNSTSCAG